MATPEAEVVKINTNANVVQFLRPDFSGFDKPVLGWNITLTNDIDNEDMLTIDFADLPKFNGATINKRQQLIIPSNVGADFVMRVRDITYNMRNNKSSTTLILATNKILLDNYIPGGLFFETKPTIQQIFDGLVGILSPTEFDIDSSIDYPQANFSLSGNQNVLDYLKDSFALTEGLTGNKDELVSWWVDVFNVLHIQKTNGYNRPAAALDYTVIRNKLEGLSIKIKDRWEKTEVSVPVNLHEPAQAPQAGVSGVEFSISGANVSANNKTIPARTSVSSSAEVEASGLQNVAKNDTEVELSLRGFYWIFPHNRATLDNFPVDFLQGTFLVSKLEVADRGNPSTTISLKLAGIDMLQKLPHAETTAGNEPPKKQSGYNVVQAEGGATAAPGAQ